MLFRPDHRLSGSDPQKCGSVRVGDDTAGTQKRASFPPDACRGLNSLIELSRLHLHTECRLIAYPQGGASW